MSELRTWFARGGHANLVGVLKAMGEVARAARPITAGSMNTADWYQVDTAEAHQLAAAEVARTSPPPACVPGVSSRWIAAMTDLAASAQKALDANHARARGNISAVRTDLALSGASDTAGANPIAAFSKDVSRFLSGS
jgi:hypothetical protein